MISAQIRIERVVFSNAGGFVITRAKWDGSPPDSPVGHNGTAFGAVGELGHPPPKPGDVFSVTGRFEDSKYGTQLRVSTCAPVMGSSVADLVAFLRHMPGIGQSKARRMVAELGRESTLAALDSGDATALSATDGVSKAMAELVCEEYQAKKHLGDALAFCTELGLGERTAEKAMDKWKGRLRAVLTEDPYRLMDLPAVGFLAADETARLRLHVVHDDPRRLRAAGRLALDEEENDGHCWFRPEYISGSERLQNRTGLNQAQLMHGLRLLTEPTRNDAGVIIDPARVVIENEGEETERWWIADLLAAEEEIVTHLQRLMNYSAPPPEPKAVEDLDCPVCKAKGKVGDAECWGCAGSGGSQGPCQARVLPIDVGARLVSPVESCGRPIYTGENDADDRQPTCGVHFGAECLPVVPAVAPAALTVPDDLFDGVEPAPEQREIIDLGTTDRVAVLTGGPGCIDASTELLIETDGRKGKGGRKYSVETAFWKFHQIRQRGRGGQKFWTKPVRTLSMNADGAIGYNEIQNIVFNGVKTVFVVETREGRRLLATADHPFKVPNDTTGADEEGYKLLEALRVGDSVVCRRTETNTKKKKGRNTRHRPETNVPAHPNARVKRVTVDSGTYEYKVVRNARLRVEADINGLSYGEFIRRLQYSSKYVENLQFLSRETEVHHKNEDPTDDRLENLQALSKEDHARVHGRKNRQHFGNQQVEEDVITSIHRVGERPVYDLVMADPDRNYVAGGFVIHNCGKSFASKAIVEMFDANGLTTVLAAPTGKAAKRLSQATGREASTIHRLLKMAPGTGFRHDDGDPEYDEAGVWLRGGPVKAQAVLVDECSMIPTRLFLALVRALPDGCRLILVGDADQLPSIGPGQVLEDLLESLPSVKLERIFRQSSESAIPWICRDINSGYPPELQGHKDFRFIPAEEPEEVTAIVNRIATEILPTARKDDDGNIERRAFDPVNEVVVIAPQRKTECGVEALNRALQAELNPKLHDGQSEAFIGGGYKARNGDRVLHTKNNYDLDVMNGDVGRIVALAYPSLSEGALKEAAPDLPMGQYSVKNGKTNKMLVVEIDGRKVAYGKGDIRDLHLGYALTCHKMQGSQAPAIVVAVHSAHSFMLARSLVYTAASRAAEYLIMVGQTKALEAAVRNTRGKNRRTGLAARVQAALLCD